jgi:hypothetical protein
MRTPASGAAPSGWDSAGRGSMASVRTRKKGRRVLRHRRARGGDASARAGAGTRGRAGRGRGGSARRGGGGGGCA